MQNEQNEKTKKEQKTTEEIKGQKKKGRKERGRIEWNPRPVWLDKEIKVQPAELSVSSERTSRPPSPQPQQAAIPQGSGGQQTPLKTKHKTSIVQQY